MRLTWTRVLLLQLLSIRPLLTARAYTMSLVSPLGRYEKCRIPPASLTAGAISHLVIMRTHEIMSSSAAKSDMLPLKHVLDIRAKWFDKVATGEALPWEQPLQTDNLRRIPIVARDIQDVLNAPHLFGRGVYFALPAGGDGLGYAGVTTGTFDVRYAQHAKSTPHNNNATSRDISLAIARYGVNNYIVLMLEYFPSTYTYATRNELQYRKREDFWIKRLNTVLAGHNMRREIAVTPRTLARHQRKRQRLYEAAVQHHLDFADPPVPPYAPPAAPLHIAPLAAAAPLVLHRVFHSHDWGHRFLSLCKRAATLHHDIEGMQEHLTTFTHSAVKRLYSYASANVDNMPNPHASAPFVARELGDHLLHRLPDAHVPPLVDESTRPILVLPFAGHETESLRLATLLKNEQLLQLLPPGAVDACKRTLAVHAFGKTARDLFDTSTACAIDDSEGQPTCVCHHARWAPFRRPYAGGMHVFSASCIQSLPQEIRELLHRGGNMRFATLATPASYFENFAGALATLVSQLASQSNQPIIAFVPWRTQMLQEVNTLFEALPFHQIPALAERTHNTGVVSAAVIADGTHALRRLLKHFVLTSTDKLSDTFSLVCKQMYHSKMRESLTKSAQGISTFACIDSEEVLRSWLHETRPQPAQHPQPALIMPLFPARAAVLATYQAQAPHDHNPRPHWIGQDVLHTFDDGTTCVGRIVGFTPADAYLVDLWQVQLATGQPLELDVLEVPPLLRLQRKRIIKEVTDRQLQFLTRHVVDPARSRDPETGRYTVISRQPSTARLTTKLHKGADSTATRMISSSRCVPTTSTSIFASAGLNLVCVELDREWTHLCHTKGMIITPGCPIIPNVKAVRTRLATRPPPNTPHARFNGNTLLHPHDLVAADFSTLYDQLMHDSVESRLRVLLDRVFARQAALGFHSIRVILGRRKDGVRPIISATWTAHAPTSPGPRLPGQGAHDHHPESSTDKCLDAARLLAFIVFTLRHSFVSFRGVLYHQVIGLPMGTNMAPLVANTYLYSFEYDFLGRCFNLLNTPEGRTQYNLILCFCIALMCRFIDDVFMRDPPGGFDSIIYDERATGGSDGLYPAAMEGPHGIVITRPMQLNLTDSGVSCDFMDSTISQTWNPAMGRWVLEMSLYYKFAANPTMMSLHRGFPHVDSAVSRKVMYNVVLSELCRFADVNTRFVWFRYSLLCLVRRMLSAGYAKSTVRDILMTRGYQLLNKRADFSDIRTSAIKPFPWRLWNSTVRAILATP